jgi:hypothetical protein
MQVGKTKDIRGAVEAELTFDPLVDAANITVKNDAANITVKNMAGRQRSTARCAATRSTARQPPRRNASPG